jgi:uncharacterized membrane protein YvbJ
MYCSRCGAEQSGNSKFCNNCGLKFTNDSNVYDDSNQFGDSSNYSSFSSNINSSSTNPVDNPSDLAGVASCCFPVVGLILYFLWREEKPRSAKRVCNWMIAGAAVYVLLYLIFFATAFSFSFF